MTGVIVANVVKLFNSLAKLLAVVALATLATNCKREEEKTKVVVLGFDGAGWDTIEPLIEAGKLPYLQRLRDSSAWAPLQTFKPTKSPVIWTSIATGKSMLKHGIVDFVYLEENDIQVPYSNSEKREPSLWQILDRFERRSAVVNWFVTYPPDTIDGVMVSNRFRKTLLLQGERAEQMRDSVHPPELFDDLKPFIDLNYEDLLAEKHLPDLKKRYEEIHPGKSPDDVEVLKDFWIYVLQEVLNERAATHLYQTEDVDFFAAYFRLPDIVQHFALQLVEPALVEQTLARHRDGELTAAQELAFREQLALVLEPFYRYMERIIEAYVSAPGNENTYFVVVSDHGFTLHGGGYDHYHIPQGQPAPSGIFLMHGPDVRAGKVSSIGVYDIAPTLLYLFDLPIGESMDGRAVTEMLSLERELRFQRYGPAIMETRENRRDEEINEQTLRELRSLGYIQ